MTKNTASALVRSWFRVFVVSETQQFLVRKCLIFNLQITCLFQLKMHQICIGLLSIVCKLFMKGQRERERKKNIGFHFKLLLTDMELYLSVETCE
jgi:hypothetical protein